MLVLGYVIIVNALKLLSFGAVHLSIKIVIVISSVRNVQFHSNFITQITIIEHMYDYKGICSYNELNRLKKSAGAWFNKLREECSGNSEWLAHSAHCWYCWKFECWCNIPLWKGLNSYTCHYHSLVIYYIITPNNLLEEGIQVLQLAACDVYSMFGTRYYQCITTYYPFSRISF